MLILASPTTGLVLFNCAQQLGLFIKGGLEYSLLKCIFKQLLKDKNIFIINT